MYSSGEKLPDIEVNVPSTNVTYFFNSWPQFFGWFQRKRSRQFVQSWSSYIIHSSGEIQITASNHYFTRWSGREAKHIIGLVLERFPYLSLKYSKNYGDKYGNIFGDSFNLDNSASCPICNRDHKEKSIWKGIKGEWGSGDYCGERTYRLICLKDL